MWAKLLSTRLLTINPLSSDTGNHHLLAAETMTTMRRMFSSLMLLTISLCYATRASASVAGAGGPLGGFRGAVITSRTGRSNAVDRRRHRAAWCTPIQKVGVGARGYAAVIPGDSFTEEVLVGGVLNFLSIYNLLITGRVILSWVPQLQGVQALQPVFLLTDPYLNAFRRLNLTFGGLDFSVLPAFLLLSFATNAVASLGAEMPQVMKGGAKWWHARKADAAAQTQRFGSRSASGGAAVAPDAPCPRRRLFAFR